MSGADAVENILWEAAMRIVKPESTTIHAAPVEGGPTVEVLIGEGPTEGGNLADARNGAARRRDAGARPRGVRGARGRAERAGSGPGRRARGDARAGDDGLDRGWREGKP